MVSSCLVCDKCMVIIITRCRQSRQRVIEDSYNITCVEDQIVQL